MEQTPLTLVWAQNTGQLEDCFSVRQEVFVEEQGFIREFDDTDKTAYHLLGTADGAPVATARLFQQNGQWTVGRICVRKPFRGKGLGRVLLTEVEHKARELGASYLYLDAQVRAEGFYKKLGYCSTGEKHLDEGCPHVGMRKALA